MPDVFVPQDTIAYNEYYSAVIRKSLPNKFSLKYVDSHRQELSEYSSWNEVIDYIEKAGTFGEFISYVTSNGIKKPSVVPSQAMEQLKRVVYAGILYDALDTEEYMAYINSFDTTVKKAIEILEKE